MSSKEAMWQQKVCAKQDYPLALLGKDARYIYVLLFGDLF